MIEDGNLWQDWTNSANGYWWRKTADGRRTLELRRPYLRAHNAKFTWLITLTVDVDGQSKTFKHKLFDDMTAEAAQSIAMGFDAGHATRLRANAA